MGTKFLDAARQKQLIGMLPLREHERRLERMVDGRSAKDVWRRWRGSCLRYHAFPVPLVSWQKMVNREAAWHKQLLNPAPALLEALRRVEVWDGAWREESELDPVSGLSFSTQPGEWRRTFLFLWQDKRCP